MWGTNCDRKVCPTEQRSEVQVQFIRSHHRHGHCVITVALTIVAVINQQHHHRPRHHHHQTTTTTTTLLGVVPIASNQSKNN